MDRFDILMVGNFAVDKLIVDGVEEITSGGGVYYGSIAAKRVGASVAVVTRLHPDEFWRLEEMRSEGVMVYPIEAEGTSGNANYYLSTNMETRICKPIGFGGKYSIDQGLSDLHDAAYALHAMGPKEIVLTQSSGVTVYTDGKFFEAPFTPRSLAGRTGRGDTCFCTYIAKRIKEDPLTACQWAGVVTTLKQEKPGPWKGTTLEVENLLNTGSN